MTSEGLETVVRACTSLEILNIIDACQGQISDECMGAIGHLPNLEELDLKSNTAMTAAGLTALSQCQYLHTLNLDRCMGTDYNSVEMLCRALGPSLRTLNLGGCWHLGKRSLVAIATFCPNMENLCLSAWTNVDDKHVVMVCARCTQLQTLNISYCPGLACCIDNCQQQQLQHQQQDQQQQPQQQQQQQQVPQLQQQHQNDLLLTILTHCRYMRKLNLSGLNVPLPVLGEVRQQHPQTRLVTTSKLSE